MILNQNYLFHNLSLMSCPNRNDAMSRTLTMSQNRMCLCWNQNRYLYHIPNQMCQSLNVYLLFRMNLNLFHNQILSCCLNPCQIRILYRLKYPNLIYVILNDKKCQLNLNLSHNQILNCCQIPYSSLIQILYRLKYPSLICAILNDKRCQKNLSRLNHFHKSIRNQSQLIRNLFHRSIRCCPNQIRCLSSCCPNLNGGSLFHKLMCLFAFLYRMTHCYPNPILFPNPIRILFRYPYLFLLDQFG